MVTPNEAYPILAKALDTKSVFFKREDLHPFGSHKGRSMPFMIDTYINQGHRNFAISSSGNAALAAAFYVNKLNEENINNKTPTNINTDNTLNSEKISLEILIGQHISTKKLRKLEEFKSENISVTMHDRPLQTLFTKTNDTEVKALRQSNDDTALIGYAELAEELLEIPDLQAVFIGTSSGTTAQGLAECFKKNEKNIEIHIVQTSSCHPISDAFINDEILNEKSVADAIVDQTAFRKEKLIQLVTDSGGAGWIVSNEQIHSAREVTKKNTGLDISTNSTLSVAGLMQAIYTGKSWTGSVACMICGD